MLHCSNKQSQSSVSYNNITASTHGKFTFHGHKGCLVSATLQGSYCTRDSNASQTDFVPQPSKLEAFHLLLCSCQDITHNSPNHISLGRKLCCLD